MEGRASSAGHFNLHSVKTSTEVVSPVSYKYRSQTVGTSKTARSLETAGCNVGTPKATPIESVRKARVQEHDLL